MQGKEGEGRGGEGEGRLKSRNIKAFPAAELSHVRGLVPSLGEAAGPGAAEGILKRGRLPEILGGAGGVQAESFCLEAGFETCLSEESGRGGWGPVVSCRAGGQESGPPSDAGGPGWWEACGRASPVSQRRETWAFHGNASSF